MNAGEGGDLHGGGDGSTGNGTLHQKRTHIAPAGLGRLAAFEGEALEVFARHADAEAAIHDGDGRGDCAMLADDGFDVVGHLQILRIGHAMGDDGGFERHDRLALG